MKTRTYIFETLKAHLRARGLTYLDVARALDTSEPTVKRMFAGQDCTLERLEQVCAALHIELRDLIKSSPRPRKLLQQLTPAQEREFAHNKKLLLMAICVMGQWSFADMVKHLTLGAKTCAELLHQLDRMGFIELHPRNRYRLLVAREFAWIPDGPIMRMVKGMAGDYFNHGFDQPGETLKIINVRVSHEAAHRLKQKLERIAQEYADQVGADAHLPLHERPPLSICIAARAWIPAPMAELIQPARSSRQETT